MTIDQLLDRLVVPRPNGSEGLERAAALIERLLRPHGSEVLVHGFDTNPFGFQLLFLSTLFVMLAFTAAMWRRCYGLGLFFVVLAGVVLMAHTEYLYSPFVPLVAAEESNIEAIFPGRAGAGTLILSAHYDTATQYGDHYTWTWWGTAMGAALLSSMFLAVAGIWQQRRGRELPRKPVRILSTSLLIPFAAMTAFFSLGPVIRAPSPGALDNAGSVAVLLRLAELLSDRPPDAPTTIKLLFLAAEEEGALGPWHYAQNMPADRSQAVINLEMVGTGGGRAYAPRERFALRSYEAAPHLVRLVDRALAHLGEPPLQPVAWPGMALSDARSFLAHGIPAVTIFELSEGRFPRALHSPADNRNRLSVPVLNRTVEVLRRVVVEADSDPTMFGTAASSLFALQPLCDAMPASRKE